jgi:hypothetical protein
MGSLLPYSNIIPLMLVFEIKGNPNKIKIIIKLRFKYPINTPKI